MCPALAKIPPFWIVGLARRQPCCTLTHRKDKIFSLCRVAKFPQSKFFRKTRKKRRESWRIHEHFYAVWQEICLWKPYGVPLPNAYAYLLDFSLLCSLIRLYSLDIKFLFIESRFCYSLSPLLASRRIACVSLMVGWYVPPWRTFTAKLSAILGTHKKSLAFGNARLKRIFSCQNAETFYACDRKTFSQCMEFSPSRSSEAVFFSFIAQYSGFLFRR